MKATQAELVRAHQETLLAFIEGYGQPALSERVKEAFFAVPRHLFVERYRGYRSPTWHNVDPDSLCLHLPAIYALDGLGICAEEGKVVATMSSPGFVLWMLDQLDLRPGMRVLEIGAGSGWNAGLLGWLVGPHGAVDSVEIIAELAAGARRGIERAKLNNVRIIQGDAGSAVADDQVYDRAVFTAGSYDLPAFLFHRVRDGGLLELPLKCPGGGDVLFLFRKKEGSFLSEISRSCEFVAITGAGRIPELDAIPLEKFAPWPALASNIVERRPFFFAERGPERFLARSFGLRSFLAVVEPRMRWFSDAFALWDETAGSLALVRDGSITVHGDPAALTAMEGHLRRWLALGMPSMATMSVRAYPAESAPPPGPGEWIVRRPNSHFLWRCDGA